MLFKSATVSLQLPDGKAQNRYAYDGKPLDSAFAQRVVGETHDFYARLKAGTRKNVEGLALSNAA